MAGKEEVFPQLGFMNNKVIESRACPTQVLLLFQSKNRGDKRFKI
jgi:hypothetical protein